MNKIIFTSYCHDHLAERFGLFKLQKTFEYFNPDQKLVLYSSKDIDRVYHEYNVNINNALPCLMLDVKKRFNTEFVCHIDADSLVFGKLDEILECNYDIAAPLNNHDMTGRDERKNRPRELWDLDNNKYVSCGCLCTSSEDFLSKWIWYNSEVIRIHGSVKEFWLCDQNWMNILFHKGGYNSKILDPLDGNVFYGPSANMISSTNNNPEHVMKEWGVNSWQSWFDLEYKDGEFYLYGKKVKILHNCGGGNPNSVIKCSFKLFNPIIKKKLQEITGFDE